MSIRIKDQTPPFATLPELLRMRARTHGDVALTICGERLTFQELDRRSDDLARGLALRGIGRGDRVATLMANRSEQALIWFATSKLGAIVAPLNFSLGPSDLTHTIKDVSPALVVADERGLSAIDGLDPAVRESVSLAKVDAVAHPHAFPFEELYRSAEALPAHQPAPGDVCCILFTGGTTGLPKGVLLSHFYYIVSGYRWAEAFKVTSEDHHYSVLQFYHIGVQSNAIISPLVNGYPSTIDRWFSVSNYWQRVREVGATIIDPMGTMFTLLFQQPPSAMDKQHKVRAAWGASAMLPPGVASGFAERFGIHLVPVFGGTEIGGSAVVHTPIGAPHHEGTYGRANGWCEIRVVDENDCALPPGSVGQIVARPTIPFSMMNGYHNNPARTIECWRNLWFHTGDLGLARSGRVSELRRPASALAASARGEYLRLRGRGDHRRNARH